MSSWASACYATRRNRCLLPERLLTAANSGCNERRILLNISLWQALTRERSATTGVLAGGAFAALAGATIRHQHRAAGNSFEPTLPNKPPKRARCRCCHISGGHCLLWANRRRPGKAEPNGRQAHLDPAIDLQMHLQSHRLRPMTARSVNKSCRLMPACCQAEAAATGVAPVNKLASWPSRAD